MRIHFPVTCRWIDAKKLEIIVLWGALAQCLLFDYHLSSRVVAECHWRKLFFSAPPTLTPPLCVNVVSIDLNYLTESTYSISQIRVRNLR